MRHTIYLLTQFSKQSTFAMLLAFTWIFVGNGLVSAEDLTTRISQHLESGEFGPALQLAEEVKIADARDQLLLEIARAQFQAGVRDASFATAAQISNDQSRSSLLSGFADQRLTMGPFSQSNLAGRGGGVVADFEPLMELIQATIEPDSWVDAGGTGSISEFASGVIVDPAGTLQRIESGKSSERLIDLRNRSAAADGNTNTRRESPLRKVSLTRLEKEFQLRMAKGLPNDQSMQNLAGIYEIQYLIVYPETGDIVIAGPAGDWMLDDEGRQVNVETRKPLLRLDDFVVCLRNAFEADGTFGCSIDPRKENLANTKTFLATSNLKGEAWRNGIREALGMQDIIVNGIDPRTMTAKTLVEADYRMKLVGMGLEPGIPNVKSYLELVKLDKNGNPPPMDVVRWWFTLNYEGIAATEQRNAFEFRGTGVKVLSEQELLDEKGKRIHTGKTGGPTLEFADSFTTHFSALADEYPIYAELKNVFDFALVAALIQSERLDQQVGWNKTFFGTPADESQFSYPISLSHAPTEVDSVMNHRILEWRKGRTKLRHTIVGISGGVSVNTHSVVEKESLADSNGTIKSSRVSAQPQNLKHNAWWWD